MRILILYEATNPPSNLRSSLISSRKLALNQVSSRPEVERSRQSTLQTILSLGCDEKVLSERRGVRR